MTCKKCGATLTENETRCPNCGEDNSAETNVSVVGEEIAVKPRGFSAKRNIIIIVIAAILLIGGGITAIAVTNSRPVVSGVAGTLQLAERYLSEQNYEQAIIEFQKVLEIEPMNVDAYLGLADAYLGMGDTDKALEILREGFEKTGDQRLQDQIDKILNPPVSSSTSSSTSSTSSSPRQNNLGNSSDPISSTVDVELTVDVNNEFRMPNLIGMTWDEVVEKYGDGKRMTVVAQEEWNEVAKGRIFEQEVVESRKVKVGSTITVKVSRGIREVEIPDVTYWTVDRAEQQLKCEGFKVSKSYKEDENIAKDRIISTTPAAHEMLPQGSTVILTVSIGAKDKPVSAAGTEINVDANNEFAMPNLVGMTWEEVLKKFGNGIYMTVVAQEEWNEADKGLVFDQEIVESRKVKVGSTVMVKVSKGIREVEVPDVTDWTVDRAEQQLRRDGFKVSKNYKEDEDVTKDRVIAITPAAHEMLPQGSTVILTVSIGAKGKPVSVPKLMGMPLYEAKKCCEEYHLNWIVEYVDNEEEKDTVVGQSIPANEIASCDTDITLYVSSGEARN